MKSLNNGFIADVFPTKELKEMQKEIARVLKEREEERKKEREKAMRQYQEELNRLLDAIEGDGFYVGMPDWPSDRVVVLEYEDEEDD